MRDDPAPNESSSSGDGEEGVEVSWFEESDSAYKTLQLALKRKKKLKEKNLRVVYSNCMSSKI